MIFLPLSEALSKKFNLRFLPLIESSRCYFLERCTPPSLRLSLHLDLQSFFQL